ncbi:unnamed protein product [Miscanthus lutarioriparius]|uniref:Uncharacterized protein n=1 Tax=Miscanthus lutarioriparius TaxID=422564 RepID=A0A811PXA0_9POAL|nr:unnamed protein product [Miscanthus lutarioriparius]
MARPSATAALLLLLVLSLLAVAHCRTVAVAADHAAEPESTAAVAVSDENGLSSNPTLPAEAGASATEEEEVLPAEQQHGSEFLRLPSHRLHRHRPCSLHHHLWWKRHHGVYRDAPRRFRDHYSGHGERREAVSHLAAILPAEEAKEAEEVKPVAEPDPDRSLPDSDGREPSFADADGHDDERAAAVRAWKKEMLRRWFHFHHGMRRHRLHHDEEEGQEQEEETAPEGMNMKRFHFHHHDDKEDEEKNTVRKRPRHAEHGEDSDDEDEQVEEMVRRFRKAIMKRRFSHGHGRRFFHHHHDQRHRHAKEAEKQAGGDEQSGVMAWIRGLMSRF